MSHITDVIVCFNGLEEFSDKLERLPSDGVFPIIRYINEWLQQQYGKRVVMNELGKHFGGAKKCLHGVAGVSINGMYIEGFIEFIRTCPWRCPENVQILIKDEHDEKFVFIEQCS